MPQQKVRKNYIGIVNDAADDKRTADTTARPRPRVMGYLVGRLTEALKRHREGASSRSITS
ncbi:hypothetical protein [Bradyrhizobium sp.]|uniref:hypothetical protein n=1 Tax=Bradyrhizobium sp. TaxID=376 RepID=UPI0039E41403